MNATIQLINIGHVPAVQLQELQVGDKIMWNYGTIAEIVAIRKVTAHMYEVTERYAEEGGTEYTRRKRGDRLVARVQQDGPRWRFA